MDRRSGRRPKCATKVKGRQSDLPGECVDPVMLAGSAREIASESFRHIESAFTGRRSSLAFSNRGLHEPVGEHERQLFDFQGIRGFGTRGLANENPLQQERLLRARARSRRKRPVGPLGGGEIVSRDDLPQDHRVHRELASTVVPGEGVSRLKGDVSMEKPDARTVQETGPSFRRHTEVSRMDERDHVARPDPLRAPVVVGRAAAPSRNLNQRSFEDPPCLNPGGNGHPANYVPWRASTLGEPGEAVRGFPFAKFRAARLVAPRRTRSTDRSISRASPRPPLPGPRCGDRAPALRRRAVGSRP